MSEAIECAVVWFRRDLRLDDHPALSAAVRGADTVVPVFVDRSDEADWSPGPAKQWWRTHSLRRLREDLRDAGLDLVIRSASPTTALRRVADEVDADAVYFNDNHVPVGLDDAVAEQFAGSSVDVERFRARLLHDPSQIRTTSGGPYHVFTPFWNKFRNVVDVVPPKPRPPVDSGLAPESWPTSAEPAELDTASSALDSSLSDYWEPGEQSGLRRLDTFRDELVADYPDARDRPDVDGSSRLSPHLHFGEVSPRTAWHRVQNSDAGESQPDAVESYLRELVWRDFSYHLLVHYPETTDEPLREKFRDFPWKQDPNRFDRWKRGATGYPLVDAGMRQLRETGWMHNRVRMVVASFLTKHLLIPWQQGAEWFWERLVDADLANNTMGWQWAAGSGADAQPFFRIFNPILQSERHDPEGDYIRTWVPELADLPDDALHAPWQADSAIRDERGIELGTTYPEPIVDHSSARERALESWERIK